MSIKEFKFNSEANYSHNIKFSKKQIELITQNIIIKEALESTGKGFHVKFPNIFEKYKLSVNSDRLVERWNTKWMMFWQNQLNFAIWCATTGCGVDYMNHITASGMTGSLFKFHVYYQIRRILFEMGVALPQSKSWNAFNNSYNRKVYEQLCAEFKVDPNTDWRQKVSYNNGLGSIYNYWSGTGYHLYYKEDSVYDKSSMSFTDFSGDHGIHIDYIKQGKEADDAWSTFILDDSNGFTKAGVERINDSIRTYCWLILGSQSQTRTDILGTGTAFDAQKQFLANLEDAINSPVDLPSQISRYQDTLKYARSKVDFVYGIGLYMSPSDMELQIGIIQNYNNEIVIATSDQKLGLNNDVNTKPVPAKNMPTIQGTKKSSSDLNIKHNIQTSKNVVQSKQHDDNKTALIVGSIVIGFAFTIYEIY